MTEYDPAFGTGTFARTLARDFFGVPKTTRRWYKERATMWDAVVHPLAWIPWTAMMLWTFVKCPLPVLFVFSRVAFMIAMGAAMAVSIILGKPDVDWDDPSETARQFAHRMMSLWIVAMGAGIILFSAALLAVAIWRGEEVDDETRRRTTVVADSMAVVGNLGVVGYAVIMRRRKQ